MKELRDFFNFDYLILPLFIKSIFIFIVIVNFISLCNMFLNGGKLSDHSAAMVFLASLFFMIFFRIMSELAIILFKIHESLREIRDIYYIENEKVSAKSTKENEVQEVLNRWKS
jgi:hypothetical protein